MSAQKKYMILVKADLISVTLAALLSIWESLSNVAAVMMLLSALATYCVWKSAWAKLWFDGRAVAESIKSLSWRFMTGSDQFSMALPAKVAEERFLDAVSQVLNERKGILEHLCQAHEGPTVTPEMREIRGLGTDERKSLYLRHRLKDQQEWYSRKAEYNRRAKERCFAAVVCMQVAAMLAACAHTAWRSVPINLATFLAISATALLSWLQVKRHEELSQSYAVAAHELRNAEALIEHVDSDESLARIVHQVEEAISREHTLWVVRRSCPERITVALERREEDYAQS